MILVVALLMMGSVLAGSAVMLNRSVSEERASLRSTNLAKAFHLSEAAVDLAIQALRTDPAYTETPYAVLGNGLGGYSIDVTPNGPALRTIRATGFYPSNDPRAPGYTAQTVETVVQLAQRPGPGYGVLGEHSVQFDGHGHEGGVKLDSYDSRQGPYDPQAARANVRLVVNEEDAGAVALLGAVTVMGDIVLGPGGDPETTLRRAPSRWTSISGAVSVANAAAALEPVEMPMLPDGGCLVISGHDVVELQGGLYRFRAMHISGKGRLVFTGPAQVYVEHDVEISGDGIGTPGNLPTNLALYVKGEHVSISGDADLFAKIDAPYATVDISGHGDVYGAVTGHDIVVRAGASIHYDEALNSYDVTLNPSRTGDPLEITLLSWWESDP